ncbi:DUF4412 domain-containing protein [Sulfurovum sp. TSL1]|uniref:DUF4412 domain-containing protein n=1 Tax=Sulfurovum sp. TSL1 TaxID=2826994 RepID=UPI001CC6AB94|nr:DUF4412 domain-containing protein [Sulfurovum sp. TSL1]GIT97351.1 hypothetical protein TSL1_01720 [Sulfurovum sp. TSL1]
MKQMKLWGLLFVLVVATSTLDAETKRYQIQSAIIEYATKSSGNVMGIQTQTEGKSKTLFKEWGKVELHDERTRSVIMGKEAHSRQTTKIDHDNVYIVDYEQKSIHLYDSKSLMQSEYKDLAKNTKETILSMGGTKTGEETLFGYDCEIWETQQIKLWLHKGIILRSITHMMGLTHSIEATDIQMNVSVSDEDLKLPDFPIKTMQQGEPSPMPQMTPEQILQMQEMMKNFTQK